MLFAIFLIFRNLSYITLLYIVTEILLSIILNKKLVHLSLLKIHYHHIYETSFVNNENDKVKATTYKLRSIS